MAEVELTLVRTEEDPEGQGTFGALVGPGDLRLATGELPWKENRVDESCIPEGRYRMTREQSPRFGYAVYLLHDVPGRTFVEIHRMNWCGDTARGWKSDVEGCIGVGLSLGVFKQTKVKGRDPFAQRGVLSSTSALNILMACGGPACWLNVVSGIPGRRFTI